MTITMDFQGMFGARTKGRRPETLQSIVQSGAVHERAERLARLKAEIEAGTYFVPAADIAASVMRVMMKP